MIAGTRVAGGDAILPSSAGETAFEVLRRPEEFDALAAQWDTLVEAMPRPSPFLLHGWLSTWWRHYGTERRLEVHVGRRAGRLVAGLPLDLGRRLGVRVAQFPGGGHVQLGDILLATGEDASLTTELFARIERADLVRLTGLPAESMVQAGLVERIAAPVIDLSPGWDEVYRDKLSTKRRSQHRKRLRDLGSAGNFRITVSAAHDALEEVLRLHALRWRGNPDRSTYALPGAAAFHHDVLTALAPRARIALLQLDGRAIAFRYGFRVRNSLVGNGIGFDPAFGRYSPGWVLLLASLEHAAAEGVDRVELLGGDEPYKLQLASPEPLHEAFVPLTPTGRAAATTAAALVRARGRLKRSPTFRRLYGLTTRRFPADG